MVHGLLGDTIDWDGSDVVNGFILFFDAVDVRFYIRVFPLVFDEDHVQGFCLIGEEGTDFVDVGSFALYLVRVRVTDPVVVVYFDGCCA